jgi:hypothetical protein
MEISFAFDIIFFYDDYSVRMSTVISFVCFFDSNLFPLCIGVHRSNWCKIANMNKSSRFGGSDENP